MNAPCAAYFYAESKPTPLPGFTPPSSVLTMQVEIGSERDATPEEIGEAARVAFETWRRQRPQPR